MIFTLVSAVSVLAQGGKESKPFPARETPAYEEGDTYTLASGDTDFADEEGFFDGSEADSAYANEPSPVSEPSVVNSKSEYKGDGYPQSGTHANTAQTAQPAVVPAAPPPVSAVQAHPQPPAPQQPAASPAASPRAPQKSPPPVQTIAPTVNIIMPPAAAAPPAAFTPSMRVIPGMPNPNGSGVYRVQLGAFSNTGLAEKCFDRLKAAGFTPYYEQYNSLYRVVISGVKAVDMAAVICRLESAGFNEAWLREER